MKKTVFYSWQSDLPNGTNRTLIEEALKEAAIEISKDESVDIEPVIDRDTQGVAGAPDVIATIFKKIDAASIFVADISIVMRSKKRSAPNPNVLVELGYALKKLGPEGIVLVFNEAFGKKERLPFDLKTRRLLPYSCAESLIDRSDVKKNLVKDFRSALLTGFSHVALTQTPKTLPVIDAIKNTAPSRKIDLRSYLATVLQELDAVQPKMLRDGGTVEDLLLALPKTEPIVTGFAKTCETIAIMNDIELARDVMRWFGQILTRYSPLPNKDGRFSDADGDFFKFVGHELFVALIAPFLKEEKLKELEALLKETLRVGPTVHRQIESKESWAGLSGYSALLDNEGKKKGRKSLRADILKARHESGELSKVLPLKEFAQTDFFLYLHNEGETREEYYSLWYPQSILYLSDTPTYIQDAVNRPMAAQLSRTLGAGNVDELKRRLTSARRLADIGRFLLSDRDIEAIGSTGGARIIALDE